MADAHDADDASAVVDLVEDTIVADADAVIGVHKEMLTDWVQVEFSSEIGSTYCRLGAVLL